VQTVVRTLVPPLLVAAVAAAGAVARGVESPGDLSAGLVGHWKLRGDCRDVSGRGHDGVNHGVDLRTGRFDGRGSWVEVPDGEDLRLGNGDFTVAAWIHTDELVDDTIGDVVSLFDPARRRGFTLNVKSSSGGYQSSGDDRHLSFGIDDADDGAWEDCGRPSATSNYIGNCLTVFRGGLYAAAFDGRNEADWCHVYRHAGGKEWTDCGRVGTGRTAGVMSMVVHRGHLYAGTCTYDWSRVYDGTYDACRVYRYAGGAKWEDCGQPGDMRRIMCMATFGGRLYAGGDRGPPLPGEAQWTGRPYRVYRHEGGTTWSVAGEFPAEPPRNCFPHAMAVHDGRLFVGFPNVWAFDGKTWTFAGTPRGDTPEDLLGQLQVHSLEVFRGKLVAGMWPEARVVEYQGGESWADKGMLGDGTEINALTVYNGMLYGGTIPRGEVFRYDGDRRWTSIRRFFSPPGWDPGPATAPVREEIRNWTRVTSMTVHAGRMFAGIGSCTGSAADAPADVRGSVFSYTAGRCVSYDEDLGAGWRHVAAVRRGDRLRLYVDGRLVATSASFDPARYDLSTGGPLRIGSGEQDFFTGRIRDVRLYRRGLDEREIAALREFEAAVPAR
jgi:hypothetical protein